MHSIADEVICFLVVLATATIACLAGAYFTYLMINLGFYGTLPPQPGLPSRFSIDAIPVNALSDKEVQTLWRRTTTECMLRDIWNMAAPTQNEAGNSMLRKYRNKGQ